MTGDQSKASREMKVFLEFLQKSGLPIERDSVENRTPPEPDILCWHKEQGFVAFELVELCDAEIARIIAEGVRSGNTEQSSIWFADPTRRIICNKLEKKYQTKHPIELLCYTAARLITPDNVIIPTVQHILELHGFGTFRRVWLLGEKACHNFSLQRNVLHSLTK